MRNWVDLRELSALYLKKYNLNQVCSRQNQAISTVLKLQSHGATEDRILYINKLLENNGYDISMKSNSSVERL
ncbi:MAG: hypothetical protein ACJ73C_14355 [Nitrososphaeraceae archaeon]